MPTTLTTITPQLELMPDECDIDAYSHLIPEDQRDARIQAILLGRKIACQAYKVYEPHRKELEADHHGEYIYISIVANDFVIDPSPLIAKKKGREKFGDGESLTAHIGWFNDPGE
jgi:hypothetical protein